METALEQLHREHPDLVEDARTAWDALTGGGGPEQVTQWWLQLFCWDQLARTWLVEPEEKWRMATALAALLDRIGLRRYADIARSDDTRQVLMAGEDDEAWAAAYQAALERSGLQVPDTDLLTWGVAMGPAEADTYERVGNALELSLLSGDLTVGGRGWQAGRRRVTDAVLTTPLPVLHDLAPLVGIAGERLEAWLRRSPTLRAAVEPLARDLTDPDPPPLPASPELLAPLAWLLDRAREPLRLTAAGYLPPAVVAAFVEEMDVEDVFRRTRREVDLPHLRLLREAAHRLGLVRRHRGQLVLTPSGRACQGTQPLAAAFAPAWLPRERDGSVVVQEVVTALLAAGDPVTDAAVVETAHAVLEEEGWNIAGRPVPPEVVRSIAWESLRELMYTGMLRRRGWTGSLVVPPGGAAVLRAALRHHLLHSDAGHG